MTSIPCMADWATAGRHLRCRPYEEFAAVTAATMGHPDPVLSNIRLTDDNGVELGLVVAPRRGVVLTANGPTIYLRRLEDRAQRSREQAA